MHTDSFNSDRLQACKDLLEQPLYYIDTTVKYVKNSAEIGLLYSYMDESLRSQIYNQLTQIEKCTSALNALAKKIIKT